MHVLTAAYVSRTRAGNRVFPYTYSVYRRLLARLDERLCVETGFTPHSPRAGFASEAIADGVAFGALKELGRWIADSSLRTYVDLVAIGQLTADMRLKNLLPAV